MASNKDELKYELRRDLAISRRLLIPFNKFYTWRDGLPAEFYEALVEVLVDQQADKD